MKILYTGRQVELAPAQLTRIQAGFAKIGRVLDGKEEKEAHVVVSHERHLHNVEITVNYYDHRLAVAGNGPDLYTAMDAALGKLEKQALKVRERWRDAKRVPHKGAELPQTAAAAASEAEEEAEEGSAAAEVFRVNHHQKRKPMTLDEALIEMEKDLDYLVYLDAETDRLSVLIRRRDGNFDLVQA
jgi:putative sigma-54 modulation protein